MGGYETSDGRTLAWGKLYRSGVLSQLTAHDLIYLKNLGIQLVCDLRSQEEVEKRSDKLPTHPAPHYCHYPAQSLERRAQLRGLTAVLFNRAKLEGLMDEGYNRIMIDDNAALIGNVLKQVADPSQLPIIIHCSAGKDRTAVIMALILSILNVPQDTILADYTLSNVDYEKVKSGIAQEASSLQRFGITVDHLQAVILVKAERLQKMFSHIEQKYGSSEAYLRSTAGLTEAHFAQIKQNLLTN
jgi:protein-tyrosine phosphatase